MGWVRITHRERPSIYSLAILFIIPRWPVKVMFKIRFQEREREREQEREREVRALVV